MIFTRQFIYLSGLMLIVFLMGVWVSKVHSPANTDFLAESQQQTLTGEPMISELTDKITTLNQSIDRLQESIDSMSSESSRLTDSELLSLVSPEERKI